MCFADKCHMFAGVVEKFVNGALASLVEKIDKKCVKTKVLENRLEIEALDLYKFALLQFGISLRVIRGAVLGVNVVAPIFELDKKPCVVKVSSVSIVAAMPGDDPATFLTPEEAKMMKEHMILASHVFMKHFRSVIKLLAKETARGVYKDVLRNLDLSIENIRVIIEIPSGGKCHRIGVGIEQLVIDPETPEDEAKAVTVSGLSAFIDINVERIDTGGDRNEFCARVQGLYEEDHSWIIEPTDIIGNMKGNKDYEDVKIQMDMSDVFISVTDEQLPTMLQISRNLKGYRMFLRGDMDWEIIHEMAQGNSRRVGDFLESVTMMNRYIEFCRKHSGRKGRPSEMEEIEQHMEYRTVALIRRMVEEKKKAVLKPNFQEIMYLFGYDPYVLFRDFAGKFELSLNADHIYLRYKTSGWISEAALERFSLMRENEDIEVRLASFNVVFKQGDVDYHVFKTLPSENNVFTASIQMNDGRLGQVEVVSDRSTFCVDIPKILIFVSKLDLVMIRDTIERLKNTAYRISAHLTDTSLISVVSEDEMVTCRFPSIDIDPITYDSFRFLFSEITVESMIHDKANTIVSEMSISGEFQRYLFSAEVDKAIININSSEPRLIKGFAEFVTSAKLVQHKGARSHSATKITFTRAEIRSDFAPPLSTGQIQLSFLQEGDVNSGEALIDCVDICGVHAESLSFTLSPSTDDFTVRLSTGTIKIPGVVIDYERPLLVVNYNSEKNEASVGLGIKRIELQSELDTSLNLNLDFDILPLPSITVIAQQIEFVYKQLTCSALISADIRDNKFAFYATDMDIHLNNKVVGSQLAFSVADARRPVNDLLVLEKPRIFIDDSMFSTGFSMPPLVNLLQGQYQICIPDLDVMYNSLCFSMRDFSGSYENLDSHHLLTCKLTLGVSCFSQRIEYFSVVDPTDLSCIFTLSERRKSLTFNWETPVRVVLAPLLLSVRKCGQSFELVNRLGVLCFVNLTELAPDECVEITSETFSLSFDKETPNEITWSILRDSQTMICDVSGSFIGITMSENQLLLQSLLTFNNQSLLDLEFEFETSGKISIPKGSVFTVPPHLARCSNGKLIVEEEFIEFSFVETKTLKIRDVFLIVHFERDPSTFVSCLTFIHPYYLRNLLPSPIAILFENHASLVVPSKEVLVIDFVEPGRAKLPMDFSSLPELPSTKLNLSTVDKFSTQRVNDIHGFAAFLSCHVNENKFGAKEISVSAPVFMFNMLAVNLGINSIDSVKYIQEDTVPPILFSQVKEIKLPSKIPVPLYQFPDDEFSVYVTIPYSKRYAKRAAAVTRMDTNELIYLPVAKDSDLTMPAFFEVRHGLPDYPHTTHIYLKPYLYIVNSLSEPILVDGHELEPGNSMPLSAVKPSLNMEVTVYHHVVVIDINNISDFSIEVAPAKRVKFTVSTLDGVEIMTVEPVTGLPGLALVNETDITIAFCQKDTTFLHHYVTGQTTCLFDLTDSRENSTIHVFNEDFNFDIDINVLCDTSPCPGVKDLFYSVSLCGARSIVVITSDSTTSRERQVLTAIKWKLPEITILVHNRSMIELLRITAREIQAAAEFGESRLRFETIIKSLQIDDMNEFAVNPVVLVSQSNEQPFMSLIIDRFLESREFKLIFCQLSPLLISLDMSLISDLVWLSKEVKLTAIRAPSDPFRCHQFHLAPTILDVSFYTRTQSEPHRRYPPIDLPRYVSLFPSFENLELHIEPLNASRIFCQYKEFGLSVADHFTSVFSHKWLSLIGSAVIIGNPQKLIRRFSSAFNSPSLTTFPEQFLRGTVGSVLGNSEASLKSVSSSLKAITDDNEYVHDNRTATGALSWGFRSLFSGIGNALTGVIRKPIEQGRKEGFKGVVKGVGSGVLGVFTNSVGGAIDFGAGIITGVRRSIFGEEAPRRVSEPLASEIDVTYLVYYRQGLIAIYPDRVTTGQDTFPLNQLILVECDDAIFRAYSDQAQPIIILVCARPEQARDIRDLIRVLHTHDVLRQLSHATSQ